LVLDEPKDEDIKFEIDDLTYLIDKQLSEQVGTVTVDFVDSGWQQGFVLSSTNPIGGGASCDCSSGTCG